MVKPESIFASYQLIPLRFLFFVFFLSARLNLPGVTNQNTQISEDGTHPPRGLIRVPEHRRALGGRLALRLVALPQPTPLSPAPSAGILTAAPVRGVGWGGALRPFSAHAPLPLARCWCCWGVYKCTNPQTTTLTCFGGKLEAPLSSFCPSQTSPSSAHHLLKPRALTPEMG